MLQSPPAIRQMTSAPATALKSMMEALTVRGWSGPETDCGYCTSVIAGPTTSVREKSTVVTPDSVTTTLPTVSGAKLGCVTATV